MKATLTRLSLPFTLILSLYSIGTAQLYSWKPLGYPFTTSAPYQGSTIDSAGVVYVAMEYGGVFRSTDRGAHWGHSYFEEGITSELFSDADGYTYAGVKSNSVVRTSDGGMTWEVKNSGLPGGASIYAFGSINGNTLLIGTYPAYLFSSSNHGDTWNMLPAISSFTTAPGSLLQVPSGDIFMGTLDSGLFRSSDGCSTWSRVPFFSATSRISDIASLPDGAIIVANTFGGVYSSEDNGTTWKKIFSTRSNFFFNVGTYSDSTIICNDAVGGIYRSHNRGKDWDSLGLYNVTIRSIVCARNGDLFTFPAGSLPVMMRHGESFWRMMQISNLSVLCMAVHDSTLMIGSESSAYSLSIANTDWSPQSIGTLSMHDILFSKKGPLYAANYGSRVYKTLHQGMFYTWKAIPTPIAGGYSSFALAENDSGALFAGTGNEYFSDESGGVFCTTDAGASWNESGKNLPAGSVHELLSTADNTILASVAYSGIYRLPYGDSVWTPVTGFPLFNIGVKEALARDSTGRIYCGTESDGIFISIDDGKTWNLSAGSAAMNRVTDLLVLPNGTVLATTKKGLYSSIDTGKSWVSKQIGLTSRYTWAAAVDAQGYVYIGTYGAGIFKSSAPVTAVSPGSQLSFQSFQLSQNYPNPFNPSTTISFSLPSASMVTLTIFDGIGREVDHLISEALPSGTYERRWNAEEFPTGTYFYRLRTNTHTETKKLLLVK
ncbi:MAG: YCF48-related protein [Bacteriovoracaceae bacterium]